MINNNKKKIIRMEIDKIAKDTVEGVENCQSYMEAPNAGERRLRTPYEEKIHGLRTPAHRI